MLIDKKIMASGILMIGVGIIITSYLNLTTPMGEAGMTEDEVLNFLMAERENADYKITIRNTNWNRIFVAVD